MADIWTNLNTFKLGDVEAANIQRQTDPIHIEELNRSVLGDVKLINDATMRNGLPIPNTMVIEQVSTVIDDDYLELFAPASSEVWELLIQWEIDRADSISFYLGTPAEKNTFRIAYFASTGPDLGSEFSGYVRLMYPYRLYAYISTSSGANVIAVQRYRVR